MLVIDILEIGVPFSDPVVDGTVNQLLVAQRALDSGMMHAHVFKMVKELRVSYNQPIVFYTYYNMIHSRAWIIIVKLPLPPVLMGFWHWIVHLRKLMNLKKPDSHGLKNIFIVAPTITDERMPLIASKTNGFIYYVSRLGVTGTRDELSTDISVGVDRIKKFTDIPVVVGFGISKPEHVKEVGSICDGVVVGALVNEIANNLTNKEMIPSAVE